MAIVHHRYATVDGHRLFYREAGDDAAPVLVLLHGFPTSSHMFRHLIPALAGEYGVIAPDLLGFGLSDAPSVDTFGWRLALGKPAAVTAIISQNGNAYDAGFVESFWKTVWDYQSAQTPEAEAAVRQFFTLEATRWQYVTGVQDQTLVDPESWFHDYSLLSRPGNDAVQLALFRDYATNPPLYPRLHEYFRATRVPLLAVWGRGDQIFGPARCGSVCGRST